MATEGPDSIAARLTGRDWSGVLRAVAEAEAWLRTAAAGSTSADSLVRSLVEIARHPKWEVRRAVVQVAGIVPHPAFDTVVSAGRADDNSRVRQASDTAATRRRDWQATSLLGRQHEDRINAVLGDIDGRFGARGRDAVKRAGEQLANTFARELHHEVIKLLTPLALSVERLEARLGDDAVPRVELAVDAARIRARVGRVQSVLESMRAYTALPDLAFESEEIREVIDESVSLVRDAQALKELYPGIEVRSAAAMRAEVVRVRLGQAFTNILWNAVESYDGLPRRDPIRVVVEAEDGCVIVTFEDAGCGMSPEMLADAQVLFTTSKPHGTGFGLPLAIKIVESEHGGRVTLDSVRGRGTRIRVQVPMFRRTESR
jgi:nitrogen fixation/metabolism regulation signal transduction histidine kinase